MCNTNVSPRPQVSQAERQARIQGLRQLDAKEYRHFLHIVMRQCHGLGDYDDILQETLKRALEEFNGACKLTTFIYKYSFYTAMTRLEKDQRRKTDTFTKLIKPSQDGMDELDELENLLPHTEMPEIEGTGTLDPAWIAAIERAIDRKKATRGNYYAWIPRTKELAKQNLRTFCESVNADCGIGITEYNEVPPRHRKYRAKNRIRETPLTRPARSAILDHLAEANHTTRNNIVKSMTCLKKVITETPPTYPGD